MLSTEDRMIVAMRRISQAVDQYSRQLWQQFGITVPQLAVLREVMRGEHVTPGTLALALHLSQPTVTGILTRLEANGWILRSRSKTDRRSVIAGATEQGQRVAAAAPPLLRDQFRKELQKLPDWQQTDLLAALQQVAAMLHAPDLVGPPLLYHDGVEAAKNADGKPARVRKRRTTQTNQRAGDPADSNGVPLT